MPRASVVVEKRPFVDRLTTAPAQHSSSDHTASALPRRGRPANGIRPLGTVGLDVAASRSRAGSGSSTQGKAVEADLLADEVPLRHGLEGEAGLAEGRFEAGDVAVRRQDH